MWKAVLISLALNAVLDLLLDFASKMRDQADTPYGRERWEVVISVLLMIKSNPNLLKRKNEN